MVEGTRILAFVEGVTDLSKEEMKESMLHYSWTFSGLMDGGNEKIMKLDSLSLDVYLDLIGFYRVRLRK